MSEEAAHYYTYDKPVDTHYLENAIQINLDQTSIQQLLDLAKHYPAIDKALQDTLRDLGNAMLEESKQDANQWIGKDEPLQG